jgi:hypothetical protein
MRYALVDTSEYAKGNDPNTQAMVALIAEDHLATKESREPNELMYDGGPSASQPVYSTTMAQRTHISCGPVRSHTNANNERIKVGDA